MASHSRPPVDLSPKIDFSILSAYADGEQDLPANVAERIGADRGYVNTRFSGLADYGLLTRVGPAENTGLYRITARGVAALELRDAYRDPDIPDNEFDDMVDERARQISIRRPRVVDEDVGEDIDVSVDDILDEFN